MSRTVQIGASFAIVLVAYSAYALLAVPLIETQVRIAANPDNGSDRGRGHGERVDWDLSVLFPQDAWERQNAKIISSNDRLLLLWKDYATKPNNWVELNPLTLIFMRDEAAADQDEALRHAIVMEVPAGANLRFDRPLDLKHGGGMGRLIEGQLRGQVTIRSRGKRPDHQDDLWARTHDVALTEQRITTPNQVEFCYGPSWGRGRQLEIKLLPQPGPHTANQDGPERRRHQADRGGTPRANASGNGPGRKARGGDRRGGDGRAGAGARPAWSDRHALQPSVVAGRSGGNHVPRSVPLRSGRRANGNVPRPGGRAKGTSRRRKRPSDVRCAFCFLYAAIANGRRRQAPLQRAGLRPAAGADRGERLAHRAVRTDEPSPGVGRAVDLQPGGPAGFSAR